MGSLWTEAHWSCSTITLILNIRVGSASCELSIFFLKKKSNSSYFVHGSI